MSLLQRAFEVLENMPTDVVLGPATDGGYYLIGMRYPLPELFDGIEWGTGEVLQRSLERAALAGFKTFLLPQWSDIDTPADLYRLAEEILDFETPPRHFPRHTAACVRSLAERNLI